MTEEQHNDPISDATGQTASSGIPDAAASADAAAAPADAAGADAFVDPAGADAFVDPAADDAAPVADDAAPYGVGPFSLREVILGGVWLVAFVVSFFSTSTFGFSSVWGRGIDWVLTIGVPTVAVFLIVLRRLSPSGIRRVGSLGIDQFASVSFSVAAVLWLGQVWAQLGVTIAGGPWVTSWVIWVETVLMLAGVVLTVLAPLIPGLAEDFQGRPEVVARPSARSVRPVAARPRPAPPAAYAPQAQPPAQAQTYDGYVPAEGYGSVGGATGADQGAAPIAGPTDQTRSLSQTPDTQAHAQPVQQAFWALSPEERDVIDENGAPIFRIGPTAWALVIEDRGTSFVIRHEDGRVGLLTDVSGVTRG